MEATYFWKKQNNTFLNCLSTSLFALFFLCSSPICLADLEAVKEGAAKGEKDAQFQLALYYLNAQEGLKADPKEACKWFLKAAEQEHIIAQYNTGICYSDGVGFSKDPKQAFDWFLKSANLGSVESIYPVARAYHFGEGVPVDLAQAMIWYQKGIEKKDLSSVYGLALIYTNGSPEIPKDHEKALVLYQTAANAGYAPAQFMMGVYYEKGWGGLEINPQLAFEWYSKAAAQKYNKAFQAMASLYKNQKKWSEYYTWIQKSAVAGMPEAQLELAIAFRDGLGQPANPKEAFKWFLAAAKEGAPQAQYELGKTYKKGTGLDAPNNEQAFHWIEEAAKQNYGPAMVELGQLYWAGIGVTQSNYEGKSWIEKAMKENEPEAFLAAANAYQLGKNGYEKSEQKAFEHYIKSAQLGSAEGQFQVGLNYSDGHLIGHPDEKEAFKWLEYAADQNHKEALYEVARRYEDGIGVPADKNKALKAYQLAANQGESKAQLRMAKFLMTGQGVTKDTTAAFKLIQEAAERGYGLAQYELGLLYLSGTAADKNAVEAVKWFEKSAYKGITESQYQLGLAYGSGLGIKEDKIKSYAWLNIAAKSANQKMVKARDLQMKKLSKEEMNLAKVLLESINSKMLNHQ
jgi:TPR repeat protein